MRKSLLSFLLLAGFVGCLAPLGCGQSKAPEGSPIDTGSLVPKPSPAEKTPPRPPHLALRRIVPDPNELAGGYVNALAFSPDSDWLAIAKPSINVFGKPEKGLVHLRRLTANDKRFIESRDIATALAVRRQDGLLAIGTGEEVDLGPGVGKKPRGEVLLLEPRADKPTRLDDLHQIVRDVAFSADGKTLAVLDSDRHVTFWDVASRKESHQIYSTVDDPTLALSSDGKRLATTHSLLDLTSGKQPKALVYLGGNCVSFSPDGKLLAVGDGTPNQPGYVTLYDAATGEKKRDLKGDKPDKWVRFVAFSPDSKVLAAGYAWGVVKLFDPPTGKEILSHDAQEKEVRPEQKDSRIQMQALIFSPDGKTLAAGFSNGRTVLWEPVLNP